MDSDNLIFLHIQISELMDVDLLREQDRWREVLVAMRCRLMEISCSCGYPVENMQPWLRHLDWQLFKALEVQYRIGLETLNLRMPEMRIDMVCQHAQLVFQPPFEEVRLPTTALYFKIPKNWYPLLMLEVLIVFPVI